MSKDQSTFWVDIELENPLSAENHQDFIELLNESVSKIVDADNSLPEASGRPPGIRVILPDTPDPEVIDRLSFIFTGLQHHRIPVSAAVRSGESLEELEIPDSA